MPVTPEPSPRSAAPGLTPAADSAAGLHPRLAALIPSVIDLAAAATALLGAGVLAGWLAHKPAITQILPGLPSMKVNTALAFLASGLALGLLNPRRGPAAARAGAALAVIPLLIGALTLLEYGTGLGLGIDEWLVADPLGGVTPGRPSPITALTFLLTGGALLAALPRAPRLLSQGLASVAAVLALLGLLGYLYDAGLIRNARGFTSMAVHTVAGFHVLLGGVLLLRPETGFMRLLLADDAGGMIARRLAPTVVIVGVLAGWAGLQAQRIGLVDANSAVALLVTAVCGFVVVVTLGTASLVSRSDRALRTQQEKMQLSFRHSAVGSAIVSLDGRFDAVNDALCAMVGYSAAEMTALKFQDITHPDDLAMDLDLVARLLAGELSSYQLQKRYLHKDGRVVWVRISVALARDERGAPQHFIVQVEDITQRHQAQEDAARALRELESFSYSVAHDLRAPLRAMSGFTRLLERRPAVAADPQARELMGLISDGAARMGKLIDDLLQLSRVERAEFRREPVDLTALAGQVFARLVRDAGRDVAFEVEPGLVAEADPGLLRIALENLLGNALKYTRQRADARITVGATGSGRTRTFFVRDNGVGFDMAYAGKLFKPFQRLHSPSEFEGTGIGLATVQRVIERHGGRISGEGRVGEGATFTFTLEAA